LYTLDPEHTISWVQHIFLAFLYFKSLDKNPTIFPILEQPTPETPGFQD
jgi:hypothetical protein